MMMPVGLGYIVDLEIFDQVFGVESYYPSSIDIFSDRGTLFHILEGGLAGYLGDGWAVALTAAFGGYELAKLSVGEPVTRIAGTWVEYALGALTGAILKVVAE